MLKNKEVKMTSYHEPVELISEHARNCTRAINSMKEELEAVDWYNQRVEATQDESLKAILAHNRNEEIEHACMVLEWLRRNMDGWDEELRTYLFTEGDITTLEEGGEERGSSGPSDSSLGVGKIK
jgi:ferritin-like protein